MAAALFNRVTSCRNFCNLLEFIILGLMFLLSWPCSLLGTSTLRSGLIGLIWTTLSLIHSDLDMNHYVLVDMGHNPLSPFLKILISILLMFNYPRKTLPSSSSSSPPYGIDPRLSLWVLFLHSTYWKPYSLLHQGLACIFSRFHPMSILFFPSASSLNL